jgi:hypothetical protein
MHLNFYSFDSACSNVLLSDSHGGKAASLLTKPAASGDAFASLQGGRNKMRPP